MRGRSREKLSRARRIGRGLAVVLALLSLWPAPGPLAAEALVLETRREPLNPEDRSQTRLGALEFRGGLSIRSPDPRFGGLSGLLVEPDGSGFLAVTDAGNWVSAALIHDAAGRLIGLGPGRLGHLPGADGRKMSGKRAQDAEAVARLSDGSLVVGFEHDHRIWRYGSDGQPFGGRPRALSDPPGLTRLPRNNGLEAMAGLPGGGLLALAQDRDGAGQFPAYLWRGQTWRVLSYPASGGFEPSGATRLPDGDLVVLERSYSLIGGVAVRLMRLERAQLGPDAPLRPRELGRLKPPLTLDNFEAIDSRIGPAGETLVYILSDDNFSPWQRTLLLQFALVP